jgi:hypothetical protein
MLTLKKKPLPPGEYTGKLAKPKIGRAANGARVMEMKLEDVRPVKAKTKPVRTQPQSPNELYIAHGAAIAAMESQFHKAMKKHFELLNEARTQLYFAQRVAGALESDSNAVVAVQAALARFERVHAQNDVMFKKLGIHGGKTKPSETEPPSMGKPDYFF